MSEPGNMPTRAALRDRRPARSLRQPTGRTWADIGVLLTLAVLGLVGFQPSFGGYGFLLPALGGLVLGAVTALAASALRLSLLPTLLVALAGYFLFGSALAVPGQAIAGVLPSLQSLSSLAVGAVYGWADILTLRAPVGAPQYIAVVPYVATWLVALVSVTLAARWLTARPRTAWRFAVTLLGPLAIYLASILIGTEEPFRAGVRGTAFAALALLWLGWRPAPARNPAITAEKPTTSGGRRRLAGIAVVVGGAVLLGGGIGFVTAPAEEQRFVLRDEIEPPFDPREYPSPLAGFRHYTKQVTDEVLFTVRGLQPGDTVRLAAMDSYNGKLWNVTGPESSADGSGSFRLVGRDLPAPDFITGEQRFGVTFTIAGYDDVWMPSIGYPTALDFHAGTVAESTDDLRYNDSTGTAALTSGLTAGDSYTIDAVVQQPIPVAELTEAQVAAVELPPVHGSPDIVAAKAQEFAADAAAPAAQLEAIRLALAGTGYLSHGRASDTAPSRAGHGADRVAELLERNQLIGDQEQYASAFALMARSFGYPARVVMGFAPEITDAGTVEVTGDDVTAWVEVAFDEVGWVAFNPTPEETDIPQDQAPKPQSEPQPQVRQPPMADKDQEDLLTPVELEDTEQEDDAAGFTIPGWVYAVGGSLLAVASLVFGPMLLVGLLKARRAARRRAADTGHARAAGAWEELVDRFSELGFQAPAATTRRHTAEGLERQAGGVALRPIAEATDDAVFSGREIPLEQAETLWQQSQDAVLAARGTLPPRQRFVSRYRLRARSTAGRARRTTQRTHP